MICTTSVVGQLSPQSKKITQKFFPDSEHLQNITPALQKKRGFTDYEELMSFLNDLVQQHPNKIQLSFIGESQKKREIPLVRLTNPNSEEKIKVWMQGGLHGNEPASTESMLYLIHRLLNDETYTELLNTIDLAVVPMANIDGYLKNNRYAANGLDLNRDQTKLMAQESVFLKTAFSDFCPEVGVDFHEYRPYRRDYARMGTFGVTGSYDAMFLYSGNLNVPENLRTLTDTLFVENARKVLDKNKFSHHAYVTTRKIKGAIHLNQGSVSARSSATNYALTNTISSLIEIRGVGLGKTSFKRRIESSFLIAISYLKTAAQHQKLIKDEISKATNMNNDIVVTSKRSIYKDDVVFIDLDTEEIIDLNLTIRDALQSQPKITRKRPVGYLIESNQTDLIEKLKVLGINVEPLTEAKEFAVESLEITMYDRNSKKYEKMNQQTVQVALKEQFKKFEKGTFFISLEQRKSNLVVEVLEPEAPNSFVSFGVLETSLGDTLPIYRIVKNRN
jgi:hypothetical protein